MFLFCNPRELNCFFILEKGDMESVKETFLPQKYIHF